MEVDVLRERWAAVRAGLIELIDQLADDAALGFRPFEGARDVGAMLRHIAHEEEIELAWGVRRAVEEAPPEPEASVYGTREAIRGLLERVHGATAAYLAGCTQADLDAEVETAWGARARQGDLIWHTLEHEIHHRGELSLVLGMLGREGIQA